MEDGIASPVLSDGAASYTQSGQGLVSESRGGTTSYYHGDSLGTTRSLTSASQAQTDTFRFDAFGLNTGRTGTTATPFGFVGGKGYQADSTGLMLLGHRYYDASTGRFLSRDPIQDGYNWYTYCNNDPSDGTDPTGLLTNTQKRQIRKVAEEYGWTERPGGRHQTDFTKPGKRTVPMADHPGDDPRYMKQIIDQLKANVPYSNDLPNMTESHGIITPPDPKYGAAFVIPALIALGEVAAVLCGGACFTEDTPVLMADGTMKRIDKVQSDDLVLSSDSEGHPTAQRVLEVIKLQSKEITTIRLDNGEVISTTRGHQICLEGKRFVPAYMIQANMRCRQSSGTYSKVIDVRTTTIESHPVYNLEVEGSNTYFVGKSRVWVRGWGKIGINAPIPELPSARR